MAGKADFVVKSASEAGRFFDVSRQTIWEWRQRGMPVTTDDRFDLSAIAQWRETTRKRDQASNGSDLDARQKLAEVKKLEAQARHADIRAKKAAGEVVNRDAIAALICIFVASVRTRIQAMPGEVATSIPLDFRHDLMIELEQKFGLILTEMSNWNFGDEIRGAIAAAAGFLRNAPASAATKPRRRTSTAKTPKGVSK